MTLINISAADQGGKHNWFRPSVTCSHEGDPPPAKNHKTQPFDGSPKNSGFADNEFLTYGEEQRLARAWRDKGDRAARDRLILCHKPLVCKIASKYRIPGLSSEDLINEGFIGLIEAVDKFNPDRGNRLSTFAYRPINWALLAKARQQKLRGLLSAPTIAAESDEGAEVIAAEIADDIDCAQCLERAAINAACLDARSQRIYEGRTGEQPITAGTLAAEFGISHQRVSQIEREARAAVTAALKKIATPPRVAPAWISWTDRPPGGLPSNARHIREVYREWWDEQQARGWPASHALHRVRPVTDQRPAPAPQSPDKNQVHIVDAARLLGTTPYWIRRALGTSKSFIHQDELRSLRERDDEALKRARTVRGVQIAEQRRQRPSRLTNNDRIQIMRKNDPALLGGLT